MILACGTGGCLVVGIVAGAFLLCKYVHNRIKGCTCKKHGCGTKKTISNELRKSESDYYDRIRKLERFGK